MSQAVGVVIDGEVAWHAPACSMTTQPSAGLMPMTLRLLIR